MLRLRPFLSVAALMSSAAASASSDSQIWGTASANIKLGDKWLLSNDVVTRFSDNRDGLYEVEAATLLGYRPANNVTVSAGYVHDPQYAGGDFTVMERRAREQI